MLGCTDVGTFSPALCRRYCHKNAVAVLLKVWVRSLSRTSKRTALGFPPLEGYILDTAIDEAERFDRLAAVVDQQLSLHSRTTS